MSLTFKIDTTCRRQDFIWRQNEHSARFSPNLNFFCSRSLLFVKCNPKNKIKTVASNMHDVPPTYSTLRRTDSLSSSWWVQPLLLLRTSLQRRRELFYCSIYIVYLIYISETRRCSFVFLVFFVFLFSSISFFFCFCAEISNHGRQVIRTLYQPQIINTVSTQTVSYCLKPRNFNWAQKVILGSNWFYIYNIRYWKQWNDENLIPQLL